MQRMGRLVWADAGPNLEGDDDREGEVMNLLKYSRFGHCPGGHDPRKGAAMAARENSSTIPGTKEMRE